MVAGIEERFFEKGTHGRRPKYSMSDLDKGHFRYVLNATFQCMVSVLG